jgi:DNA-binding response OmpR family regulator
MAGGAPTWSLRASPSKADGQMRRQMQLPWTRDTTRLLVRSSEAERACRGVEPRYDRCDRSRGLLWPFRLQPAQQRLLRDGQVVEFGARALDLLIALVEISRILITKEMLLSRVWGRVAPALVPAEQHSRTIFRFG